MYVDSHTSDYSDDGVGRRLHVFKSGSTAASSAGLLPLNVKPFSRPQQVAGLTTLAAMLLALVLDNSPAVEWYGLVHHLPVMLKVGTFTIDKPLILWINDGLMVFFFLLITLELKREILEGQLSTSRSIATPAFAALGGMLAPGFGTVRRAGAGLSQNISKRSGNLR